MFTLSIVECSLVILKTFFVVSGKKVHKIFSLVLISSPGLGVGTGKIQPRHVPQSSLKKK